MNARVVWNGEMKFGAEVGSGGNLQFDSEDGPTPMEALLCSVAACTAMDVVSILEKMRQSITSYHVEIEGERPPAGTYPRPFTKISVRHVIQGSNLDPSAVEKAVRLSDEKYCSVSQTLGQSVPIDSSWTVS